MSNEYVNRLRLAGEPEAVKAFVSGARDGDDHFALGDDTLGAPGLSGDGVRIEEGTTEPTLSESNGLAVAEYVLVTRRGSPWDLAERLSTGRGMVVSLASVEPGNRMAEVRVYGGGRSWSHELGEFDYDTVEGECLAEEVDPVEDLLDALQSESASVVDDYEVAAPAHAPGM